MLGSYFIDAASKKNKVQIHLTPFAPAGVSLEQAGPLILKPLRLARRILKPENPHANPLTPSRSPDTIDPREQKGG